MDEHLAALDAKLDAVFKMTAAWRSKNAALLEKTAKWRSENAALRRELDEEIAAYHVPIAVRQLVYDTLQLDGTRRGSWRVVKKRATEAWKRVLRESPECVPATVATMSATQVGECLQRAVLDVETSFGHLSEQKIRADIAKIPDLANAEERKQATYAVALCDAIKQAGSSAAAACPPLQ